MDSSETEEPTEPRVHAPAALHRKAPTLSRLIVCQTQQGRIMMSDFFYTKGQPVIVLADPAVELSKKLHSAWKWIPCGYKLVSCKSSATDISQFMPVISSQDGGRSWAVLRIFVMLRPFWSHSIFIRMMHYFSRGILVVTAVDGEMYRGKIDMNGTVLYLAFLLHKTFSITMSTVVPRGHALTESFHQCRWWHKGRA